MRFMILVPGNEESESGVMPSAEAFEEMNRFNEEMVQAGVMLAGEGLHPTSEGARIRFDEGGGTTVIDGPFSNTEGLIAGYWIIQVGSKEEAIEWARRAPFDPGTELTLRRVYESEDFGDALPEHVRETEERIRAQAAERNR